MTAPLWRPPARRRPHSANSATMETGKATSLSVSMETGNTLLLHGQASSLELDFTDKLKALRELITSSKMHREARKSGADRPAGRVIAKRTDATNFCEARQVDEKLKFTANSFERRELALRARKSQMTSERVVKVAEVQNGIGDGDDEELSVDSDGEKYSPRRALSALGSYSHLSSSELALLSYTADNKKLVPETDFHFLDKGVRSEKVKERLHTSLGLPGHGPELLDIPERDWNTPPHATKTLPDNETVYKKNSRGKRSVKENCSENDVVLRESRWHWQKSRHGKQSPPEHDYSSEVPEERAVQTNVKIFGREKSVRERPGSAELSRNKVSADTGKESCSVKGQSAGDKGHWTQLLSQKRDKLEIASRSVPSSPVQSNLSLDLGSRASPYAFLLQEAVKHQKMDGGDPDLDRSRRSSAAQDLEATERQGKNRQRKKNADSKTAAESHHFAGDVVGNGESLPDEEVASIMDHPKPRKRIIVKRSALRSSKEINNKETDKKQDGTFQLESQLPADLADTVNSVDQGRSQTAPPIAKDDHIMTLDKLRAALRGRRSESRPPSLTSSLNAASPSPLKAVHASRRLTTDDNQTRVLPQNKKMGFDSRSTRIGQEAGSADSAGGATGKTAHRKIIRRPPAVPGDASRDRGSSGSKLTSSGKQVPSSKQNHAEMGIPLASTGKRRGSEDQRKMERPSSVPILVPGSTSGMPQDRSKVLQGKGILDDDGGKKKMWPPSPAKHASASIKISQLESGKRRSRSSTDFTEEHSRTDLTSVQVLRTNVQRLHQEVSLRIGQDAYVMQNLMNKVSGLEPDKFDTGDLDPDIQAEDGSNSEGEHVRRRLSFNEDGATSEEVKPRLASRSKSCVPFKTEAATENQQTRQRIRPSSVCSADSAQNGPAGLYDTGVLRTHSPQDSNSDDDEPVTSTPRGQLPPSAARVQSCTAQNRSGRQPSDALRGGLPGGRHSPAAVNGQDHFFAGNLRQNGVLRLEEMEKQVNNGRTLMTNRLSGPSKHLRASTGELNVWGQHHQDFISGSDAADTILSQLGNAGMVHLLQQLYTADDNTRQAIITKAQYFKHWQSTAHILKQQRQVYTESLRRAQVYQTSKLRHRYFHHWQTLADENQKNRAAEAIYRQHMLRKGLQAFSWAITRSKHQCNTLKMRVNALALKAAFAKWHALATALREERIGMAFTRWREFTHEERSVRAMQKAQNMKVICQTMVVWKQALDRRVKENLADRYLRLTLLRHSWQTWCVYKLASREKAARQQAAEDLRKRNLQRRTLCRMRVALRQSRLAHQHFRRKRLKQMLQGWRHGAQISRVERQLDMASSLEHWRYATTRHTFIRWCQQLHHRRATVMAIGKLSRKTFEHWRHVWQVNMERRQAIEAAITRSRLHKCLLTWRRNVVDQRRRQRHAVSLLEMCLLRETLLTWRRYTAYKTGFRASLQLHVRVIERTKMLRCFSLWRDSLRRQLDERRRHELWSLSCVRKATVRWKHICHLRHLEDTLRETQPHRELSLIRRMFARWQCARDRAEEENAEVVSSCRILQRCSLQRRFQAWHLATQRALTVKPLIQRKQRLLVTWCFDAWHEYVEARVERRHNAQRFHRYQLAKGFARWRRQFQCQQMARAARQTFHQRLVLCLLQEWCHILHRKHRAADYHCRNLLRATFCWWSQRCTEQLQQKRERWAQQELSQHLKRQYFEAWWAGVHRQMAANSEAIARLQQRQAHSHIRAAFFGWRRTLHSHLVMRAYQQSARQRLQRRVLLEWHATTSHSLSSAVQHFVQQLGLEEKPMATSNSFGDLLVLDEAEQLDSPRSSNASLGFSVRRLFSSGSEMFVDGDLDRTSLLNKGLTETLEGRRMKNQRLQEITLTFVTRLSHWPVSLAFSQWREFALRQRELHGLALQVRGLHSSLTMALTLRVWRSQHTNSQTAVAHRNAKLLGNSLLVLREYSQQRKAKAVLAEKARRHLVKHVLSKVFPMWLAKAQDQQHERSILHLWTTATPEQAQLLPLEMSLSRRIRQRSLRECLSIWRRRFLFLSMLKMTYHKQLLGGVLTVWQEWASVRQEERRKEKNFLQARRKNLVFKTWCERLHQRRETEVRYRAAWQGYLRLIFKCWQEWASVSKRRRLVLSALEGRRSSACLASAFRSWRRLTECAHAVRSLQQARLIGRVFSSWRQVVQEGKQLRQVTLAFQASCLARQVGRLFQQWRHSYRERLKAQRKRQQLAEQSALHCGRAWRKKAQNTRGRKLIVVFKYSRLSQMFQHWRAALGRIRSLKLQVEEYVVQRNKCTLRRVLLEWHQRLQSAVITRTFTQRLLATVLAAWRSQAHASRERRIRGLALQRALQEQNLRCYFLYWRHLTLRVRSLQNNVEVKLQLRVLQAWRYTVRRRCSQRRTGEKLFALRQHRQMASAFMTVRCRFDYCQGLRETADRVCADRERAIAGVTLRYWKEQLDRRLAARFYTRLLAVRTATRWQDFVVRRKMERQYEAEQLQKAVVHHNKHICSLVIGALKTEVTVSRQLQKRRLRLGFKFALSWKHLSDMSVTASCMEQDKLYAKYWRVWRLALVRQRAISRDEGLEKRQILSQVFTAWCNLCPFRVQLQQRLSENCRPQRAVSSESRCDSPSTPRSFLPVPVSSSRRQASDNAPQS